mgnify:CR=1 FL=1
MNSESERGTTSSFFFKGREKRERRDEMRCGVGVARSKYNKAAQ